ncbi:hypothetical protein U1Q18_000574 [Sarracenia purpurea var. burkii]
MELPAGALANIPHDLAKCSNLSEAIPRRSANYHPSIWGDHFLAYASDDATREIGVKLRWWGCNGKNSKLEEEAEVEELKSEVRMMLSNVRNNPLGLEETILVDSLQRLGVAYHFEYEIEMALKSIYSTLINGDYNSNDDNDLYMIALSFRLLRQHGYHVSSDLFRNFKDEKGEFKSMLKQNAKTLLCLYEASHLRVRGEKILEEALEFSMKHLQSMLDYLSYPLSEQVKQSLELPHHKGMPRLKARQYILLYQADVDADPILLELAKRDFNLLQSLHQREISEISRWWKETSIPLKLPFARDRLVECYFWILGVYYEPNHSKTRIFMTKVIQLASVIDDIYDVYGTFEELKLFTDTIERWKVEAINDLPEYMQICFMVVSDVMKEMEDKMTNAGRSYDTYYAKEAIKVLVRAYFQEANWFHKRCVPTFEEYLSVSVESSGYPMLAVQSLVGMGSEVATNEAFEWLLGIPKIVKSSALIARLVDDIQTHKVEQERGDAPSGIECYMRQHDISEEEACERMKELVKNAWEDINEELQKPDRPPLHLLVPPLNLARMMEVIYGCGDGFTTSIGRTKDMIASLLDNPITI